MGALEGEAVPKLTIDLQDGFSGEDVIVRVNGEEVERRRDVRTKRTLGLAQSFDIKVPDGPVTLEVDLPSKGAIGTTQIHRPQLGVSWDGEQVQFIHSDKEFGYG
jgi:membrane-associated protease RseP (regulator of RpoE activity)